MIICHKNEEQAGNQRFFAGGIGIFTGGLFPLFGPEGLPVLLGAFLGVGFVAGIGEDV